MKKRILLLAAGLMIFINLQAQLTIRLSSIPVNTPPGSAIHIAGNFQGWNPGSAAHILTPDLQGQYNITLNIAPMTMEFKFTRGSWPTVEGTSGGGFIPNRTFNYTGGAQELVLAIAGWEDLGGGGSGTAAPNVSIISTNFFMPQLNRSRRIWVYVPPDYATSTKHYPVLYMQDGQNLFDQNTSFAGEWRVDESLNDLFQAGDDGIIVVGIDNGGGNRINEYSPWVNPQYGGGQGDEYIDFIVETLKPHIDSMYRTRPQQPYTGIMGSSLGGLISHFGGIERQDVFGKVGVFSPSYWFSSQSYSHTAATGKQADMRIFLLAGQLEGSGSVVNNVNAMYDTLLQAGFGPEELQVAIHADGQHSEWYWAREFPAAYQWLFADVTTTSTTAPQWTSGFSIAPNPADSFLRISTTGDWTSAAIALYDFTGRLAMPLRALPADGTIDVTALAPGMYVAVVFAENRRVGVQKVVVTKR
jgi:predicted alpha/beta superfamily hydrolase